MQLLGLDGWSFALTLLAAFALLALLYLRRQPARRVEVPSLALFRGVPGAGSRRLSWAPLSLWLALLIATLLLAALADPRPRYEARDYVLLIDRGIAMSARDVAGSRLAAAKRAAHARVDALRPGDRAQIVSFASHASAHSALSDQRPLLHAAIDGVVASAARSDGEAARALLKEGARSVLFASERTFAADEFVRIGTSQRNVGITRFRARSYPLDRARASCLIEVRNFGPGPEQVTLRLRADGPLYEETFSLAAGAALTRTLDDLPGRTLEASIALAQPDPLPEDDRAAVSLSPRTARVLLVSPGNRYLEAALLVDPQLTVTRRDRFEPGDFELVIFDRTLPSEEPSVPALYVGPPEQGGSFPLARAGMVARPYFEHMLASPLLTGLALRDINIARALATKPEHTDRVLAASGQGAPLLVEGRRRAPFVALTFALGESDLGLRAAFPVLLLRAIDQLLAQPSEADVESAGQPFLVQADATLRDAAGQRSSLPAHARVALDRAGRYQLEGEAGARTLTVLAQASGVSPAGESTPPAAQGPSWYWPWLALAALSLLVFELVAHRRGWTR